MCAFYSAMYIRCFGVPPYNICTDQTEAPFQDGSSMFQSEAIVLRASFFFLRILNNSLILVENGLALAYVEPVYNNQVAMVHDWGRSVRCAVPW